MNTDGAMSISPDAANQFSARKLFGQFRERATQMVERLKPPTPKDMYDLAHEVGTLNSQRSSGGGESTNMIVMKTFDKERYLSLDEDVIEGEYRVCDGIQGDPEKTVTYVIRKDRVARLVPQKTDLFTPSPTQPVEESVQRLELFQVKGKLMVLAGEMIGQNIAKVDPNFTYNHLPRLFPKQFAAAPRR